MHQDAWQQLWGQAGQSHTCDCEEQEKKKKHPVMPADASASWASSPCASDAGKAMGGISARNPM